MASIRFKALTKTYDNGFQAVKGIDLVIKDKEFMVLVGPSGCGKTTSLRMIAGLEEVTSGTIEIGDKVVNELPPKDRDIAMVFQSYALYPQMTVAENIAYALVLRSVPKKDRDAKVAEAAKMLGLESQLEKLPKQLSGGQRQRVALGRAIVRHPQVFLFDEPLSNLDAKLRGEMRAEIRALQTKLKTTAVYVTHDQIEAMTLGDRITVMNQGLVQQVGEPMALYENPYNKFVASFIGTPPMNFFHGVLGERGETIRLGEEIVSLAIPHRQNLANVIGKEVLLGIRPENIVVEPIEGQNPTTARVEFVELMGDHQYLYLSVPASPARVIMKADGRLRLPVGKSVSVYLDTKWGHVFEGADDDSRNLTLPPDFKRQA